MVRNRSKVTKTFFPISSFVSGAKGVLSGTAHIIFIFEHHFIPEIFRFWPLKSFVVQIDGL